MSPKRLAPAHAPVGGDVRFLVLLDGFGVPEFGEQEGAGAVDVGLVDLDEGALQDFCVVVGEEGLDVPVFSIRAL